MFSFEGDFKTRPKVSLGGASRKEEKASLLHRTQEERRKREEERRRLKNAIIIQSYIRGYKDRKQQYSIQRSEFDFCANSATSGAPSVDGRNLTLLVRKLLFFYRQTEDSKRLIWICQNLIKYNSQFVKHLAGPDRLTCLYQIKRLLGLCCRLLQHCYDDSINVALPMRMVEVFSSENTYLPVLQDAVTVASLVEQILHYMIQKGYYRSLFLLINNKLPSSVEYTDVSRVPIAKILLENVMKPLHFTYNSCSDGARQQVFTAFTREFLAAPYTDQIFQFIIPALVDAHTAFPYELFLNALLEEQVHRPHRCDQTPWLFYFVLTVGETYLSTLSEEGMLVYLRVLQVFLSQLPVSTVANHQELASDSEDDDEDISKMVTTIGDGKLSVQYITEECLKKLDTKQQTNTLLNMVWRDSASEEVFTLMASICHTLMVQHRMMVPKVRLLYSLAFNARFLRHLWYLISSMTTKMITGSMVPLLQVISRGSPMSLEDSNRIIPLFYLFSSLFSHSLISIHDNEFFGDPIEVVGPRQSSMMPFTLEELVVLSRCLRDACLGIIKLAYPETKPEVREEYMAAFRSVGVTTNVEMQQRIQTEQKRWIQLFKVVELKLGGKDIPVTSANRIAYIHLVADYRLNKQIRQHCLAFRQGLANVVNLEWLRMFDQQEIQVLISGAQVPICLDDLKSFTNYSGGYSADHPVIKVFWRVVENFTDEEKRKLLKFVTSCSRPPLLGFKELYPAFCIHNGGSDLERLPTASTCMNLLKLPEFYDENLMRSKLLYAIECAAGFELS
ncbi:LOW QUALITY PROTEIN: ubiquitin-protein ligase E3C-like [Bufo gargarizans]|uniref:LOW QUALITY PROTEIN: ubiquitin-protein ligase E3C-like n=1 Tax=Bufo gargarizans TaxID=30331 RepID=UPI001CF172F5|nr:LOW QUALITY PROTEIN: ubiquitin-protein ligase E3C-like [Bufo gargarizans]